jgi:hypothetical protein
MKKLVLWSILSLLGLASLNAQGLLGGIGLKGGLNFTNITASSSFTSEPHLGFVAGIFKAPKNSKLLGLRTEILFSKQSYSLGKGSLSGVTNLNYLMWANMLNLNITKYVSCMFGEQIGYLLNAKADTSFNIPGANQYVQILQYVNRIYYGLTGGIEIHPFKGIVLGGRYEWSFSNMFKNSLGSMQLFNSGSTEDKSATNNVQLYLGYKF